MDLQQRQRLLWKLSTWHSSVEELKLEAKNFRFSKHLTFVYFCVPDEFHNLMCMLFCYTYACSSYYNTCGGILTIYKLFCSLLCITADIYIMSQCLRKLYMYWKLQYVRTHYAHAQLLYVQQYKTSLERSECSSFNRH